MRNEGVKAVREANTLQRRFNVFNVLTQKFQRTLVELFNNYDIVPVNIMPRLARGL
jgi:hypothetical protein